MPLSDLAPGNPPPAQLNAARPGNPALVRILLPPPTIPAQAVLPQQLRIDWLRPMCGSTA
jgi:hypothetical protein